MSAGALRRGVGVAVRRLLPRSALEALRDARTPDWLRQNRLDNDAMRAVIRVSVAGGGALVDVGANRGDLLRVAVDVAPHGGHVAFEPVPRLGALLRSSFPGVTVHDACAGSEPGTVTFYEYAHATRSSMSLLADETLVEAREARLVRIDDVVPESLAVRVLKIDVEGHELAVLQGAARMLAVRQPVVVFEHGAPSGGGHQDSEAIFELLRGAGYGCFVLRGPRIETPAQLADIVRSGEAWNFLAVPSSPTAER